MCRYGELGGIEKWETVIRMYYVKGKTIFNKSERMEFPELDMLTHPYNPIPAEEEAEDQESKAKVAIPYPIQN